MFASDSIHHLIFPVGNEGGWRRHKYGGCLNAPFEWSRMIHANFTFTNRAEIEVMGLHTELQCGVAVHKSSGIATSMVSGNGYTNKDLGGYAESYLGTDIAILAAPGNKGDQLWDDKLISPLIKAQAGSLLRLFRKNPDHEYQYCGLYRIVDRWRCRERFSEPGRVVDNRKLCFVKLERVVGQDALIPVEPKGPPPQETA